MSSKSLRRTLMFGASLTVLGTYQAQAVTFVDPIDLCGDDVCIYGAEGGSDPFLHLNDDGFVDFFVASGDGEFGLMGALHGPFGGKGESVSFQNTIMTPLGSNETFDPDSGIIPTAAPVGFGDTVFGFEGFDDGVFSVDSFAVGDGGEGDLLFDGTPMALFEPTDFGGEEGEGIGFGLIAGHFYSEGDFGFGEVPMFILGYQLFEDPQDPFGNELQILGALVEDGFEITAQAVPEPTTALALLGGLAGLGAIRRRKRE